MGSPLFLHASTGDDKQGASGDYNSASPFYGNVYAVWDDGSPGGAQLRFARTTDHGVTWKGVGATPIASTSLASDSFAPEVTVAADGTIYVFWLTGEGGNQIKFVKSTDGGDSFSAPVVAVSNLTNISSILPNVDGFPEFPGATFRVITLPSICIGTGNTVFVAWADGREVHAGTNKSRIYYRRSLDGGSTWDGGPSGQPLLTGAVASSDTQQNFHPQIRSIPGGKAIGCAFYEFGPKGGGEFPSLYSKLRTSPLDIGLEQGYTCSIQLLNAPGNVQSLHPARPIEKARTSLAPFLSGTDHERVARSAATVEGHACSGTIAVERSIAHVVCRY